MIMTKICFLSWYYIPCFDMSLLIFFIRYWRGLKQPIRTSLTMSEPLRWASHQWQASVSLLSIYEHLQPQFFMFSTNRSWDILQIRLWDIPQMFNLFHLVLFTKMIVISRSDVLVKSTWTGSLPKMENTAKTQ